MSSPTTILRARFVAPIDQPIIKDGGVAICNGVIAAVGEFREVASAFPDAAIEDLESSILLPGLVNAHTHLELSNCDCGDDPGGSFADWILSVRSRMKLDAADPDSSIAAATKNGIEQCLKFGVTCVGDISNFVHVTRPAIASSPLRAVSFGEVLGLAKLRPQMQARLVSSIQSAVQCDRLTIGITPHAPYTVDLDGYEQCLSVAKEKALPLATHLSETPDETEFLTSHQGIFREVWDKLGLWQEPVQTYHDTPTRFAAAIGLLDYPSVLAHVNYCDDDELKILASGNASVVYCPRTHRYFGHQPHRWREMLELGINVAVGTDSCASSPNLNLLDDLRVLHQIAPDYSVDHTLEIGTIRGAKALGLDSHIGTIAAGKRADLTAIPVSSENPLLELLEGDSLPTATWCDGIRHGR